MSDRLCRLWRVFEKSGEGAFCRSNSSSRGILVESKFFGSITLFYPLLCQYLSTHWNIRHPHIYQAAIESRYQSSPYPCARRILLTYPSTPLELNTDRPSAGPRAKKDSAITTVVPITWDIPRFTYIHVQPKPPYDSTCLPYPRYISGKRGLSSPRNSLQIFPPCQQCRTRSNSSAGTLIPCWHGW